MWSKSAPRSENWALKSSFAVTPGSTCTARSGSSASTLARFFDSVPVSVMLDGIVSAGASYGPAFTSIESVRCRFSGASTMSSVCRPATVTVLRAVR